MTRYALVNPVGNVRAGAIIDTAQGDNPAVLQQLGGVLVQLPSPTIEAAAAQATIAYSKGAGDAVASGIMMGAYAGLLFGAATSGDVSGGLPGPLTVTGLRGNAISAAAPALNDLLQFDGASWAPAPPPSGFVSVATLNDLAALDTTLYQEGQLVYVATVDDLYELYLAGGLTVESTAVIPAAVGAAMWKRLCIPSRRWLEQTEWFVDIDLGDDEADGATVLTPLASFAEFRRRVGYLYCPVFGTTLTFTSSLSVSDPVTIQHIATGDGITVDNPFLMIGGPGTLNLASEVATVTSNLPNSNQPGSFTTNDDIFGSESAALVHNTTNNSWAVEMDDGITPSFCYQNVWYSNTPAAGGGGTPSAAPAVGHNVETVFPSLIYASEMLKSTMPGGLTLMRLSIQGAPEIENAFVTNCLVAYASMKDCTVQGSFLLGCTLDTVSATGGIVCAGSAVIGGGMSLASGTRIGSEVDGTQGLLVSSGPLSISTAAAFGMGAAIPCVEVENGASMVCTITNSLYGGNAPVRLRPGAQFRRRVQAGVHPSKSGTAILWATAQNPFLVGVAAGAPTYTELTTNTWDNVTGYGAAANTNVRHLQSDAGIVTSL